ncbi:class I SAM-dependent methyltransferase [Gillisia limnaea]|uniref:Methyltransferase type 11 n=1 Tax=Gillisia limnaea (strain DSM 15749 / LMG 21470 / R-8282) TaxID=865937 RepID=H2BT42_GILLR|nr:class I SAM-dependent methyltransferase [Gillisia limnaea]EHQ02600.1 Methyltransferase type 11 [Gillisia limnaea DSM 15749]
MKTTIDKYLNEGVKPKYHEDYIEFDITKNASEGLEANAYYFNNSEWAEEYLTYCHRDINFISRWKTALGDYSDKIVVDLGCGPGNVFANFAEKPKLLIGVDVAVNSLEFAKKHGYLPVLADASNLPFKSGFADTVILNAALHHCDDMAAVLSEAARILKPGGTIITDHDPQKSAWNYKGLALLLWKSRTLVYRYTGHGFHKEKGQQYWALKTEIHHKPGRGVSKELFEKSLKLHGFDVKIYPHNHTVDTKIFDGNIGKAAFKYRLGNFLSGRNPNSQFSALTLMCVARKNMDAAIPINMV